MLTQCCVCGTEFKRKGGKEETLRYGCPKCEKHWNNSYDWANFKMVVEIPPKSLEDAPDSTQVKKTV